MAGTAAIAADIGTILLVIAPLTALLIVAPIFSGFALWNLHSACGGYYRPECGLISIYAYLFFPIGPLVGSYIALLIAPVLLTLAGTPLAVFLAAKATDGLGWTTSWKRLFLASVAARMVPSAMASLGLLLLVFTVGIPFMVQALYDYTVRNNDPGARYYLGYVHFQFSSPFAIIGLVAATVVGSPVLLAAALTLSPLAQAVAVSAITAGSAQAE
ncbi:MAG: hypothetical protein AB2A00_42350 [Myxococcota bacterium]